MKFYIGIDWGQRKMGVAFGDDETRQAFGFGVMENNKDLYGALDMLAQEYESDTFVVGLSQHTIHDDNERAIKDFAQKLEKESGKKVVFAQEMFTTREAQSNMKSAGKTNIAAYDDVESARIILQGFLDA